MHTPLRLGSTALVVLALAIGGCKSGGSAGATAHTDIPADAKIENEKVIKPDADVHVAAGDFAVGQGHTDEAIKQYQKAIDMDPTGRIALYKLAALYTLSQNFDLGIATWQRYVDATNQSAGGYVNLARANELAGRWKEAEVAYLRAINRESNNRPAHVNYGILLAKRDRFDEAQTQLAKVLAPAEVQYDLGSVYELKKNFPAATVAFNKALELDPSFTPAQQRLDLMKGVGSAQ